MELTHHGRSEEVLLDPGSDQAIPARVVDVWMNRTVHRSRRVSLTYRKMLESANRTEASP
jgi:hypothetical protein